MSDQAKQPTEDQIKTANDKEAAAWQDEFKEEDLKIPYSREEAKDDDTKAGDKNDKDDKTTQDDTQTTQTDDDYEEPEQIVTVEDPGDFKPSDFSFDVTLKDGETVTIKSPEDADRVADNPDNFKTPKQLLNFINKTSDMRNKMQSEKSDYDKQKKSFDEQNEAENARQQEIQAIANELEYLAEQGLLPKVAPELQNVDWTDPANSGKEGIKEALEVLSYMRKENNKRAKAGVRPLTSAIDAFNALRADGQVKADKKAEQDAANARKVAGGKVAGVSSGSSQGGGAPTGIAVGNPNIFKRGSADWEN